MTWDVCLGGVLDISPQIITIYRPGGEWRIALPPGAVVWKGRTADPTALESGDSAVIRMRPGQRSVAVRGRRVLPGVRGRAGRTPGQAP